MFLIILGETLCSGILKDDGIHIGSAPNFMRLVHYLHIDCLEYIPEDCVLLYELLKHIVPNKLNTRGFKTHIIRTFDSCKYVHLRSILSYVSVILDSSFSLLYRSVLYDYFLFNVAFFDDLHAWYVFY